MKKFDMDDYIRRRIRVLRGVAVAPADIDEVTRYTQQRLKEMQQTSDIEKGLDKSLLGCYAIRTMGDRHGET